MKKFFLSLMVLLMLSSAAFVYAWQNLEQSMNSPFGERQQQQTLIVERGTGFASLTAQLEREGLIGNSLYFKLYARFYKLASKVKAGEYQIDKNASPAEILDQLVAGKTVQHWVTLVEGTNFKQLRALLASKADLLEQQLPSMSDEQLLKLLGSKAALPEGLFLAETYQVRRGSSDVDLLKRAYSSQQQLLEQHWAARDTKLPYQTPYEALIMASIVEKETGLASERPTIAGVFVSRMRKGMKLQTDPTVIYGMGDSYKGNITRRDLRKPTPYNTYVIKALPPTPIATVGPEAIAAALSPEKTPYLYFVAKGDGSHQFSKSLKAHNRAVREYQLKRTKNYRSSPEKQ